MDAADFTDIRHHLGKTQTQVAGLLGVSSKAVQSFEQGWRNIPAHVERQLLYLVYLKRLPACTDDRPCWERTKCTPETRERCMAWEVRAGDLCWFVNGTVCQGKVHKNWEEKMRVCRQCEVFGSLAPRT
jgi:DNA-binding XRE family transcriptional regulator